MTLEKRQVDLALIGAQKCGTTFVSNVLVDGFSFFRAKPAEPRIFLDSAPAAARIARVFRHAPRGALLVDDSTAYSNLPTSVGTAERMRLHNPDVRIIYCVRSPLDRIRSAVEHRWVKEGKRYSVSDALEADPEILQRSMYRQQLEPWLRCFGESHVLPLVFEQFVNDPAQLISTLSRFLERPSETRTITTQAPANVSSNKRMAPAIVSKGLKRLRVPSRVIGLIPRPVKELLTHAAPNIELDGPLVTAIWRQLEPDVHELEELIHCDLAGWRPGKL